MVGIHPRKHSQDPPEKKVSESAGVVYERYKDFADFVREIPGQDTFIEVAPEMGLVFVASQAGSAEARYYLSNGDDAPPSRPIFEIRDPRGEWATTLRWAFYTPANTRPYKVLHSGREWLSSPHEFQYWKDSKPIAAKFVPLSPAASTETIIHGDSGMWIYEEDWLLVTALPRYAGIREPGGNRALRERIINLAGLHRPGTIAANWLFDLEDPVIETWQSKVRGSPFYQALFRVPCWNSDGEGHPADIELIEAEPLTVMSADGSVIL